MINFKILLKFQIFVLIVICIILTNCKKQIETVFITPNISVELPQNYEFFESENIGTVRTNPDVEMKYKNYRYHVRINENDIMVSNTITHEFDTLDFHKKKQRLKKSIPEGFMRGFNGRNLNIIENEINGLAQCDFNFEFGTNDSLFKQYGRFIIQDSNLIYLGYITKLPPSKGSIKNKDEFFNSMTYN